MWCRWSIFSQPWTRWFVSLRDKINVIDASLVNLANVSGNGLVSKNGSSWVARVLQGVANRTNVTNGDGASGNPTVDVVTADLVAGSNVSFTGSGVGRILDNGSGNLTINASGGGGGGAAWTDLLVYDFSSSGASNNVGVSIVGYQEILIILVNVGMASSGWRWLNVSIDGGTTPYTNFYESTTSGVPSVVNGVPFHTGTSASNRSLS